LRILDRDRRDELEGGGLEGGGLEGLEAPSSLSVGRMLSIWSAAACIAREMPPDSVVRLKPRDYLSDQPYSGNNPITRN
jgi:hypothetical protein